MRAAALGVVLAVAACSPTAPKQSAPSPAAKVTPLPPVIQGGWATVFGDAKASLDIFGRLGLRPGAYARTGGHYESTATPTPMSDPSEKPVSIANFVVTGEEKTLDTVAFSLDLVGPDKPFARTQFENWVAQAMSQLGVAGADQVLPALKAGTARSGDVAGATYAVTATEIAGGTRLAVTFTSSASDRGTSQPRK